jgi:CRP-like cAMP-binding protein
MLVLQDKSTVLDNTAIKLEGEQSMKEISDSALLNQYLQTHKMNSLFNTATLSHLSLYKVEQGELICRQGENSAFLYILVKGKIKIYTTSPDGKTLILSFKTPLELIGDIEYVQNINIINTVEAISPVYLIGIHHQWLKKYNQDYVPFLHFLLHIITQKFHLKSNSMSFNLMYPVEVRLASYLLSVSYDDSGTHFQGEISTATLKDAANLIGTSYRHLNRILHRFCTDGLIERQTGSIKIIDENGLRAMVSRNLYE